MHGKTGELFTIKVPVGTVVKQLPLRRDTGEEVLHHLYLFFSIFRLQFLMIVVVVVATTGGGLGRPGEGRRQHHGGERRQGRKVRRRLPPPRSHLTFR